MKQNLEELEQRRITYQRKAIFCLKRGDITSALEMQGEVLLLDTQIAHARLDCMKDDLRQIRNGTGFSAEYARNGKAEVAATCASA